MNTSNFRRAALESSFRNNPTVEVEEVGKHEGVQKLRELAKTDNNISHAMELYNWNCRKVFATGDLSGLKMVSNAGAMALSAKTWRCKDLGSEIGQVMTFPFDQSEGGGFAYIHAGDYWDWMYTKLMYPTSQGNSYTINLKDEVKVCPQVYIGSQYLTIMNDLINEIFSCERDKATVKAATLTLIQVRHSFQNYIKSLAFQRIPGVNKQNVQGAATTLASLLRVRDRSHDTAEKYRTFVNKLQPQVFFKAMRLIASDQVKVIDSSGNPVTDDQNKPLASSTLFHQSVFYDGDMIFLSLLFEDNKDNENFTPYWVCRKFTQAARHMPRISLEGITSLDEATRIMHTKAGASVEKALRRACFRKMIQDNVLAKPRLSVEQTQGLIEGLLSIANETRGITSLIIGLMPESRNINNFDHSLAEALLCVRDCDEKKKMVIPVKCLSESFSPIQLNHCVAQNKAIREQQQQAIQPTSLVESSQGNVSNTMQSCRISSAPVLKCFIEEFVRCEQASTLTTSNAMETNQPKEVSDSSSPQISSCNQKLIKQLYDKIAQLVLGKEWDALITLIKELSKLEKLPKKRLIGKRRACSLIRHLMTRQFSKKQIAEGDLMDVFTKLQSIKEDTPEQWVTDKNKPTDSTAPDVVPSCSRAIESAPAILSENKVKCLKKVEPARGKNGFAKSSRYIANIVDAAFPELVEAPKTASANRTPVNDDAPKVDDKPIEFYPLPTCISTQSQRLAQMRNLVKAIDANELKCECVICFNWLVKSELFIPHNGHPGFFMCAPCITQVLQTRPVCPACRTSINQFDFAGYQSPGRGRRTRHYPF